MRGGAGFGGASGLASALIAGLSPGAVEAVAPGVVAEASGLSSFAQPVSTNTNRAMDHTFRTVFMGSPSQGSVVNEKIAACYCGQVPAAYMPLKCTPFTTLLCIERTITASLRPHFTSRDVLMFCDGWIVK